MKGGNSGQKDIGQYQNEPVRGALTYLLAPILGYYASMGTQIDADNICYGTGWVRSARSEWKGGAYNEVCSHSLAILRGCRSLRWHDLVILRGW